MAQVSEHDAFMEAIIADPTNDLPRLIMADWHEDRGETPRAAFIRRQVADYGDLSMTPYRLIMPDPLDSRLVNPELPQVPNIIGNANYLDGEAMLYYRRGFVEAFRCDPPTLLVFGPGIIAFNPITRIDVVHLHRLGDRYFGPQSTRAQRHVMELSRQFDNFQRRRGSYPGAVHGQSILLGMSRSIIENDLFAFLKEKAAEMRRGEIAHTVGVDGTYQNA